MSLSLQPDFMPMAELPSCAFAQETFLEGLQQAEQGDIVAAEACFRTAVQQDPALSEAWSNLAWVLSYQKTFDAAEACYRRALALNPDHAQTHLNFGSMLFAAKRFLEAEKSYRRAVHLSPLSAPAWNNLGVLLATLKREGEAECCYRHALKLLPAYAKATFNLSYLLLRQGRFEEGWKSLEARDWIQAPVGSAHQSRWQGESVIGKSVLVCAEGGYGDVIQFCRFAPLLKRQGCSRVGIYCPPALEGLLKTLNGVDDIIAWGASSDFSGWDFWTPMFSIPHFLGTRLDTIPASLPYLFADPERCDRWKKDLRADCLKIGLAWKGSPLCRHDAERSLPDLSVLSPLWGLSGIQFVSLQQGSKFSTPPQVSDIRQECLDWGHHIHDFADTAAMVACLDLLISVDTAAAHVAGALGKPVWLMLSDYMTDWRWLTDRSDSPWYPGSFRLFRQPGAGDWDSVVSDLSSALKSDLQTCDHM